MNDPPVNPGCGVKTWMGAWLRAAKTFLKGARPREKSHTAVSNPIGSYLYWLLNVLAPDSIGYK